MKIGILTFHNGTNYGGFLQCFAMYRFLKDIGHNVSVIDFSSTQRRSFLKQNFDRILSVCAGVRKHMKTHRHISSFVFERYCLHGRFLVVSFGYEELFALSVLLVFEHGWQAVCTSVSVRPCFTVCIG